jgi:hypothetical protein
VSPKKPKVISIPGPNLVKLVLDTTDPHTPAMVYAGKPTRWVKDGLGPYSSTYWLTMDLGIVDDQVELTVQELEALRAKEDEAVETENVARKDLAEYHD